MRVSGLGFGVEGVGCMVWGLGFGMSDVGLRVGGLGCEVQGDRTGRYGLGVRDHS